MGYLFLSRLTGFHAGEDPASGSYYRHRLSLWITFKRFERTRSAAERNTFSKRSHLLKVFVYLQKHKEVPISRRLFQCENWGQIKKEYGKIDTIYKL
jgi:hypothetical protein